MTNVLFIGPAATEVKAAPTADGGGERQEERPAHVQLEGEHAVSDTGI